MTSALYEPLIERDLAAIPAAVRDYAAAHSADELFVAVARFAVLAYAPSQHGKRSVMACVAAHELRDACGDSWMDVLIECARYTAESRQPWSEPPLLDPPEVEDAQRRDVQELLDAAAAGDRARAERWLSARLDDDTLPRDLQSVAHDDALLMTRTALELLPILGAKGKYALLRMPVWEMVAAPDEIRSPDEELDVLIDRAVHSRGAVDDVRAVFVWAARHAAAEDARFWPGGDASSSRDATPPRNVVIAPRDAPPAEAAMRGTPAPRFHPPPVYHLARDYAQTLIAHAVARRLPSRGADLIAAVEDNLEHGESFAEWSFA